MSQRISRLQRSVRVVPRWLSLAWFEAAARWSLDGFYIFVIVSATYAWLGQEFEFVRVLMQSAFFLAIISTSPKLARLSKFRRDRYAVMRKKVALRRRWRKTMGEVEQVRLTSLGKR